MQRCHPIRFSTPFSCNSNIITTITTNLITITTTTATATTTHDNEGLARFIAADILEADHARMMRDALTQEDKLKAVQAIREEEAEANVLNGTKSQRYPDFRLDYPRTPHTFASRNPEGRAICAPRQLVYILRCVFLHLLVSTNPER